MFLNNAGAINNRKRRKEVADNAIPKTPTNLFSLQHHQHCPQNLFSPALHLGFNFDRHFSFTSLLTEEHYAKIVEQSDQIDEIIKTHSERLRCTLAERWQRHYSTLLCAAEERASKRMKEREVELEKAVRRNAELEQRAAQLSTEAQVWRAKVRWLEETAASLTEALREGAKLHKGCAAAEDAELSYVDPERVEPVRLACKECEKRVATVMMWPCKHVCICKKCDTVLFVSPSKPIVLKFFSCRPSPL